MNDVQQPGAALESLLEFRLIDALLGRRSRRFFRGAEIPDGVLRYKSRHPPAPLSELETLLVVGACGGNTSWHHMITRAQRYAPHLSNYAGSAAGRTFPSAAGFHTSVTFFTDDDGVYLLDGRDPADPGERDERGGLPLDDVIGAVRRDVRKIEPARLRLPAEEPFVEPHNTWVTNQPGTLLIMPVADLAQHAILALCYLLQNGAVVSDDVRGRPIPALERWRHLFDENKTLPLSYVDQLCMSEVTAELSTSCFAGALMLQAMGLGGWMYDGIDPFALLGASGDPRAPGLGFRYDVDERWAVPNPTGRDGVMVATCPPHFPDMRAAVDAVCARKFGAGGPFHEDTRGPWKNTRQVRSSAQVHDEDFRACVAHQAQYIFDTFGKFPATVPSVFALTYLQAHHLDLEFYDHHFEPGAYLPSHARHMSVWHPGER